MNAHKIAPRIELLYVQYALCSRRLNLLRCHKRIQRPDLHSQSRGLASHQPSHIAESLDAQSLALDFASGSRSELAA